VLSPLEEAGIEAITCLNERTQLQPRIPTVK
jgi:hypothetical protein